LAEQLKDRWNREVEKLVVNVQQTDWTAVREDAEQRLAGLWRTVRQSETGKEVEGRAKELGEQVRTGVKETVADGREKLRETVDSGKEKVKEAVDLGGQKVKEAVGAGREKLEDLGRAGEEKVEEKTSTGRPKRLVPVSHTLCTTRELSDPCSRLTQSSGSSSLREQASPRRSGNSFNI
jgi:hypothetical protein